MRRPGASDGAVGGGKGRRRGGRRTRPALDALEARTLMAADLRFAVIGDYGGGTPAEAEVASQVQSWNPAFVTTVGDNNYPDGSAATIDANIGKYYHNFLSPYNGNQALYGAGSTSGQNEFFPALGDADWGENDDSGGGTPNPTADQPYLNYFKGDLPSGPGGGRYYDVTRGNVELFVLDTDANEPGGTSVTSAQATWLKGELAASTAQWKLVVMHIPPYSSGDFGNSPSLEWPFQAWGATAVLAGADHDYERLSEGGLPYFVDGLGGESLETPPPGPTESGSQDYYNSDYGAMLVDATSQALTFEFVSRTGQVIDASTILAPGAAASTPAAPSNLVTIPVTPTQVDLSWTDNAVGEGGFRVERSTDGVNFTQVAETASGVTTYDDASALPGVTYTYRVRALVVTTPVNSAAPSELDSAYSLVAAAATSPLPSTAVTPLGSLTLDPLSTGLSPILAVNTSYYGNPLQLGGTVYSQGVGTHAVSSLVYDLNGKYSYFLSDIGIDHEEAVLGNAASVEFQVIADGKTVYDSGLMLTNSPAQHIDLNVSDVQRLTLVVNDAGDGNQFDSADWAGAYLLGATPAPVTTATPSGTAGLNGWYAGPVSVALAATDPAYPASALTTSYSLDGGKTWVVGNAVAFTQQGVSTLLYRSTDPAGDSEAANTLFVKIDSVAPATAAQLSGTRNGDGTYQGPVTVTLSATDATSGVATTSYTLDGGSPQAYAKPFAVSAVGQHVLTFSSVDAAGNREAAQTLRFAIAQATAYSSSDGILLLDPAGRGALTATGQGSVTVKGGAIVIDSTDPSAGVVSGNGGVIADDVLVAGGTSATGKGSLQAAVSQTAATVNPLAGLVAAPQPPASTFTAGHYGGGSGTTVLSPGTYVGGITVDGGSVFLSPGLYYLQGGGLTVSGKGSLVGAGVTIYNAPGNSQAGINLSGGGLVALSPATSGPYQGITIYQDPSSAAPINLSGQGVVALAGTVYAASATLNISGQGSLVMGQLGTSGAHVIVADLDVSGQGSLTLDMVGVNSALTAAIAASQGPGIGGVAPGVVVGLTVQQDDQGNGNGKKNKGG